MRYLNAKYGAGRLLPATPEGMGNANRWMDWQLSTFNATIVPLFWNLIRTPADKRDPKAVRGRAGQNDQSLANGRRSVGEEPLSWRRRVFAGRHSARGLGLPLV